MPGSPTAIVPHPDQVLADLDGWHRDLRAQFPILDDDQAYLDSAATTQKPRAVLDAVQQYLTTANANVGRGTYRWANRTTALVDAARHGVAAFLDDPEPDRSTVHFTSGTTAALHLVAADWLVDHLSDGDEIVVPGSDHEANSWPWRWARDELARRGTRIVLRPMPYETSGDYDPTALATVVNDRTRFVALTHVHHVYGVDLNIHRVRRVVGPDVVLCLDAAQSVGHLPVSLRELDVDFLAFSGHKAMALPGIGVLWAGNRRGAAFRPRRWPGSPNTVGIVSLSAALEWLQTAGTDRIARWTVALGARLTDVLRQTDAYQVLGCQNSLTLDSAVQRRHGIVTFRHRDIPAVDLGFILAEHGLMVRANSQCQAGVAEREASVRVSLHAYSSPAELDRLCQVLTELDIPPRHR